MKTKFPIVKMNMILPVILLIAGVVCFGAYCLPGCETDVWSLPTAIVCVGLFLGINIVSYFINKNKNEV